jgi:hypothetical protein
MPFKAKDDLLDINFPMLEYTNQELQEVTEKIFSYLVPKGLDSLGFDSTKLRSLISDI